MRYLLAMILVVPLVADDSAKLEQMLEKSATLELARGTYRLKRTLTLDLSRLGSAGIRGEAGAAIVMEGAGPAIRVVGTHKGTAGPNTLTAAVFERERAPVIEGIAIAGAHPEADGIAIEGAMEPTITRVLLQKLRHGIVLTGRNRNVTISDVNVYYNSGVGILLDRLNLHQVNIANSHISYNSGGGIVVRDSEIRNLQIANCDIEANMSATGTATANVLFDTARGSIREGAITGCTLQHDGKAKGSANIRFNGTSAQVAHKVGYFSITGNHISDTDLNIHLRYARGVNITGNTFGLGFSHNLLVEGSSNVTVGPNTMDQNPDYDQAGFHNAVEFRDSADSTIQGLHINRSRTEEGSIVIRRSHHFLVSGVTVLDSDGPGIVLDQAEWTQVSNCLIADRRKGAKQRPPVRVTGGSHNGVSSIVSPK